MRVASATINPKKIPRYPSDKLVLLDISWQIESAYERVKRQRRPCWACSLIIGPYQVKQKQYILSYEWGWENYPLEEYNSPRIYFDNVKKVESMAGKEFHHQDVVEDHWMNATNDYDVRIRDYYRMTLYLAESTLKFNIPVEIRQQDSKELLDPLFNLDKIRERPIMNA